MTTTTFGLALKENQGYLARYYVKQATLVGITFAPVASYQVHEQISIGGGPNIMVGYMKTTDNINNMLPVGTGDGQLESRIQQSESAASSASSSSRKRVPVSASRITLRSS